jgi:hypothetical protein
MKSPFLLYIGNREEQALHEHVFVRALMHCSGVARPSVARWPKPCERADSRSHEQAVNRRSDTCFGKLTGATSAGRIVRELCNGTAGDRVLVEEA